MCCKKKVFDGAPVDSNPLMINLVISAKDMLIESRILALPKALGKTLSALSHLSFSFVVCIS